MAYTRKLPSKKHQGCYVDPYGKVQTVGTFIRKSDAQAAAEEAESRIRRGDWIDPALSSVTVEELSERWFAGLHSLKPKTIASYSSLLRSRVLPAFGDWQVRRVKTFDVEAWVADMVGEGLSASRTIQSKLVLQLIYDVGVRDGYVSRNPVIGVRLPRLEHREAPFFEPQESTHLSTL